GGRYQNGGAYNGGLVAGTYDPRQTSNEFRGISQDLQNVARGLPRNNAAIPAIQQAIDAANGLASQTLKGVNIDVSELTKLNDALDSSAIAVSRQLEVIIGKNNARSPQ